MSGDAALVVPVMLNFEGLKTLVESIDYDLDVIVMNNWVTNHGVSKAWNNAIEVAKFNYDKLIICNDDVVFWPGTIQKLLDSIDEVDLASAVSTETNKEGLWFESFPDYCCYAIRPYIFTQKFGTFDENFTPGYFEDTDMHYRMKMLGGRAALRLDARVSHVGSFTQFKGKDSTTEDRVVSHEMFRANEQHYINKWGGPQNNEKFTTPFNEGGSCKAWH